MNKSEIKEAILTQETLEDIDRDQELITTKNSMKASTYLTSIGGTCIKVMILHTGSLCIAEILCCVLRWYWVIHLKKCMVFKTDINSSTSVFREIKIVFAKKSLFCLLSN